MEAAARNSLSIDETEKGLGIWISSDMKCSDQCLYAFNKASKVMGMIKRTIKPVAALHQGAPGQMTWLEDPPPWLMTWLEDHHPGSGSALPIAFLR